MEIADYERRFRSAGLPNLIEGYSATEDVFTRALPFLGLVFVVEMLGAVNLEWDSMLANVAAVAGGVVLMLGAFGVLNVLRGRPFASIPGKVGTPELAAFVVLPSALPIVFGGQWRSALVTLAGQLLLLGLVYLVIAYGVFSIVRWAGARFVTQLRATLTLMVRALPLLLFFALVTFFTNEYWQMFASTKGVRYGVAIGLFALLGAAFLMVRIPSGVEDLERESHLEVPLRRAQRVNVGVVIFVSQALQVLFVTAAVGLFFVVFGTLLVSIPIQRDWINEAPVLYDLPLVGTRLGLTHELLRVAAGTAAFSGLYYAVAMVVDSNFRDEFVTGITDEMRETFTLRGAYLRSLDGGGSTQPTAVPGSLPGSLANGYALRAATHEDVPAVVAAGRAANLADSGTVDIREHRILDDWRRPRFDPACDAWVVTGPDGEVVAAAYTWDEEPATVFVSVGWVHPAHRGRGLGTALALAVERRALRDASAPPAGTAPRVHQVFDATNAGARALFDERGYVPVRAFLHMEIRLEPGVDAGVPPPGIAIRPRREDDDPAIFVTVEEAFREHWGFQPSRYEEWLKEWRGSATYDPTLWLVATEGDEIVGVMLANAEDDGRGWIGDLGVRDAWRGRGIGEALLRAAFAMFERRGLTTVTLNVDRDNATGATRLYERAGMRERQRWQVVSKTLTGAPSLREPARPPGDR
jgi:mycothiol synthase